MSATPVEVKTTQPTKTAPAPAQAPAVDSWRALRTEMDKVFDRFASGFGLSNFGRVFDLVPSPFSRTAVSVPSPAMDLTEDKTGYTLTAELPGLTEKDIDLSISGNVLTLKGEKKQEAETKDADTYLSERSYGMFQRSLYLPDGVDPQKITAEFSKGVLTVKLPKTEAAIQAGPRPIPVKAAA